MMKRLSLVFAVLLLAFTQHVHAQYYSVNYDARTVAAMAAAFGTEVVAESYYREQVDDILKHYTAAEVAAAGIFSSKFLEHKALSDLGIWCSSTENYYYRRIYHMVADKIIPKIWVVAKQMLHSPQTAIHWGSYLMKVCDETKSLCMQFESVVTNSTLSFSDIAFLEINSEVVPLLKLSELGGIDWQRMLDDFSRIPDRFTRENLQSDLDNLYNLGVGLATAGAGNLGDALLPESMFHNLLSGKVSEIANLYDHYSGLFEEAEQGIGNLLLDKIGGARLMRLHVGKTMSLACKQTVVRQLGNAREMLREARRQGIMPLEFRRRDFRHFLINRLPGLYVLYYKLHKKRK